MVVKVYRAGRFVAVQMRFALDELVAAGEITYTETKTIFISYFHVNGHPESHKNIRAGIEKFNRNRRI